MTTLSAYVTESLENAVSSSDLSKCQVVGWDKKATEKWAIVWVPDTLKVQGSVGVDTAEYRLHIAIYAPATETKEYEKHVMTPTQNGSLIRELASIGWVWHNWEFHNEDPDSDGIKLAATCVAELPAVGEFLDDGINYIDTEIVFWDIDNDEPYTDDLTIDYKLTGTEGGFHRIELIDGKRPLGILVSGGYEVVISIQGDEERLFTIEADDDDEQVTYNGEQWDLRRLHAIIKDDALVNHPGDISETGFIGANVIPQFVAPDNFYRFANKPIAWTWRNQIPEGYQETEIAVWGYALLEWDGSTPLEFTISNSVERNEWTEVLDQDSFDDDLIAFRPSGGTDRTIHARMEPPTHIGFVEFPEIGEDLSDGELDVEDWFVVEMAANNNAVRAESDGTTIEGHWIIEADHETVNGITYLDSRLEIPWRLNIT